MIKLNLVAPEMIAATGLSEGLARDRKIHVNSVSIASSLAFALPDADLTLWWTPTRLPTAIGSASTRTPVLAAVERPEMFDIVRLFQTGVRGLVSKTDDFSALRSAIVDMRRNGSASAPDIRNRIVKHIARPRTPERYDLTGLQEQLLRRLFAGDSNEQVATALHLSRHTVKDHIKALFTKLEVANRTELFARYTVPII
ncbi:helix-turn-helix transcriptional regulator [Salininema proteolyticum]|uniref:LuxR C-terminal-related transcriptional regulator n=1 Tax=Salininema proteolyticum TaxID=1607685 RepID=A0ABV8TWW1_9ACTN